MLGLAGVLAAGALVFGGSPAHASETDIDQQLGNVQFQTSCNEIAQRRFNRAMRYQHSFWYRQSIGLYEEALKADPDCAIAHWGIALALWDNPHNPPPAPNVARAVEAIQAARAIGAKTERERGYIDALALLYQDHDKTPYPARLRAHVDAMGALAAKYPDDDEAQIAYAITLNVSASPADKTYAQQLKGVALLEPIAARAPRHPGVVHYLIHLYDYPALAHKGLDAANRYAAIAPAAPHAQHMPSHIYTRVGMWRESIASNIESVKAARAENEISSQLHGADYKVYSYLQLGRDREAREAIDRMLEVPGADPSAFAAWYGLAAAQARYMVERKDWAGAAALEPRESQFPQTMAITHFARALGAARLGKLDDARADIARLTAIRDKLIETNSPYWAEQVDIQRQVAAAWLLYAEDKYEEAIDAMRAAADAEDKTDKHVVTPGPLVPARELLGEILYEEARPAEALAAFEAVKAKERNRFHGIAGAAMAAEEMGDKATAKLNYEMLLALIGEGEVDRPAVAFARDFLSRDSEQETQGLRPTGTETKGSKD